MNTKSKKLPKNFANLVLDEELKIDSGNFDISNVNKLMSLYSVSLLIDIWLIVLFVLVGCWVLLWYEWWKVYIFHGKNSKHSSQAWNSKVNERWKRKRIRWENHFERRDDNYHQKKVRFNIYLRVIQVRVAEAKERKEKVD